MREIERDCVYVNNAIVFICGCVFILNYYIHMIMLIDNVRV